MNSVVLTGNLTKDPEVRTTNTGKTVASCTIAWNRGEDVGYFDCIAFEKRAELLRDYCKKGSKILIRGELKQDKWQDKDGHDRSAIRILISEIEFLSKREQENAPASQNEPKGVEVQEPEDMPF